jgi:hypothetical protein
MWNDPRSKPHVALIDGSGRRVNMSFITADTDPNDPPGQNKLATPSGTWSPGDPEMNGYLEYGTNQGFSWTYGNPASSSPPRRIRGRVPQLTRKGHGMASTGRMCSTGSAGHARDGWP